MRFSVFLSLSSSMYVVYDLRSGTYIFVTCLTPMGNNLTLVTMRTTTTKDPVICCWRNSCLPKMISPRIHHSNKEELLINRVNEKLNEPSASSWLEIFIYWLYERNLILGGVYSMILKLQSKAESLWLFLPKWLWTHLFSQVLLSWAIDGTCIYIMHISKYLWEILVSFVRHYFLT